MPALSARFPIINTTFINTKHSIPDASPVPSALPISAELPPAPIMKKSGKTIDPVRHGQPTLSKVSMAFRRFTKMKEEIRPRMKPKVAKMVRLSSVDPWVIIQA